MSSIPYILEERPDTGLNNSRLGIWIFIASEVMLFGGLFSAYVFLRFAAPEGDFDYWGSKLNVPMATFNTVMLITSSVTMIMSWASLRMKQFDKDILHWKKYDYVIINNDLEECYKEIEILIDSEIKGVKNNYSKEKVNQHIKKLI